MRSRKIFIQGMSACYTPSDEQWSLFTNPKAGVCTSRCKYMYYVCDPDLSAEPLYGSDQLIAPTSTVYFSFSPALPATNGWHSVTNPNRWYRLWTSICLQIFHLLWGFLLNFTHLYPLYLWQALPKSYWLELNEREKSCDVVSEINELPIWSFSPEFLNGNFNAIHDHEQLSSFFVWKIALYRRTIQSHTKKNASIFT